MSIAVNRVNPEAEAWQVSLNSPLPLTIDSTDFDNYLGQIDSNLFTDKDVFTSIALVNNDTDVATVTLEIISGTSVFSHTFQMRLGMYLSCRARRILTGTSINAVFTVGVWN